MRLKSIILTICFTAGGFFISDADAQSRGTTKNRGVLTIGESDRNKGVPKGINENKFDNAKKRSKNYKASTEVTSRQKKYTKTRRPVENHRFDPVSWAKPTKWVQKRIPDRKDTDPGQQEEVMADN